MQAEQQTIKKITRDLLERLGLFDPESFVSRIRSISTHLDKTYETLMSQYDSRIFFGDDLKSSQLTEYEQTSFHLMKTIALVTEELKKKQNDISHLQEIVTATANNSALPDWLKERVIAYVPSLLIKQYSEDSNAPDSSPEYVVFVQGEIKYPDEESLNSFKRDNPPGDFDIFIENTEVNCILIKSRPNLFRAGDYHPFNILTLFLQRLGKSVPYREIYHLAIKPTETTSPRDHSKKVYDYLKMIKKTISECKEIDIDPDEWFRRDHNTGIVHVSSSINGCLITTAERLLI